MQIVSNFKMSSAKIVTGVRSGYSNWYTTLKQRCFNVDLINVETTLFSIISAMYYLRIFSSVTM